jgi:radical SAM protein with 4Fe4S-binding SPASM domain
MTEVLESNQRTTYAVWEITLKCNLACSHCGSRAGDARPKELTTPEALDLVRQLQEAGIREVTLIGGEAYLRKDWLEIAREITGRGMVCTVTTGGLALSAYLAGRMAEVGISSVSVSIDGLEATHDGLRGVPGSWAAALRALGHLKAAGIQIAVNTQINRRSMGELTALYELLAPTGAQGWQVQLTVPMGNAADDPTLLLQPYELLELFPLLDQLAERGRREGFRMAAGNNIGYFGPYEGSLRGGSNPDAHWVGCQAGVSVLGIEADGAIKGCPSLPTGPYTGANIRDLALAQIIEHTEPLNFNRRIIENPALATEHLWGFCKGCYYADTCRGGCSWTAHVFFGKRGNNPYCHHRALEHQARGVRERLVQVAPAPGVPFDHGLFEIIEEPVPSL